MFFKNVGLKFNDLGVTLNPPPPAGQNLNAGKGTATISDENGNLLFYTDGMKVWNGAHDQINAGPNLSGNLGSTQSSLIVPRPGSNKDYYIFTTDIVVPASFGTMRGFNYSRVDVTANSNQGAVTSERDINLVPEVAEMITGVKHANGTDYWVVTHGLNGNSFHAFKVDYLGVDPMAVVSSVGSVLDGDYLKRDYLGAIKLSPKGDKIAYASLGKNVVEVFSFDNNTGIVSNSVSVGLSPANPDRGPYYVEFSPDGTKLYYTIANLKTGLVNELYQYDIINGGPSVLLNEAPLDSDVSALQLARDGKIYVGRYLKKKLGVIENPNRSKLSCNYNQNGVDLGTNETMNGMPNFIQSYFDIPAIDYDTKCEGDETRFSILNTSNIDDGATWDFGDSGSTAEGSGLNPVHEFSAPGSYNVTLTEKHGSEIFTTTIPVTIHPLPSKPLEEKGDIMYLFPGSSVLLDAGEDMFSYDWKQGLDTGSDQFFEVNKPGEIEVKIENIKCCSNSGILEVISLAITLPTAFVPDSEEELNRTFHAFGPSEGIENFNLKVFNKWGQMVWETNDFDQEWDGTVKGQNAPTGLYTWFLGFDIIGDLTGIGRVKYKGTVTLLR